MRSNALPLALALLACACTTSDNLIVTRDASADDASLAGGSGGTGGANGGTGGSAGTGGTAGTDGTAGTFGAGGSGGTAGIGGSGGTGGAAGSGEVDAAVADALDAPPPPADGGFADSSLFGSCGSSCAAGTSCLCCPLGGLRGPQNCTCTIACMRDDECPQSAPHCNVKKLSGFPVGKGLCTTDTFLCVW
jgi:hypothetical protein